MKYVILENDKEERFFIRLDNWGGAVDESYRRWVLQVDKAGHLEHWRCLETGEIANPGKRRWSDLLVRRPRINEVLARAADEQGG